jgi:hypothetical protein
MVVDAPEVARAAGAIGEARIPDPPVERIEAADVHAGDRIAQEMHALDERLGVPLAVVGAEPPTRYADAQVAEGLVEVLDAALVERLQAGIPPLRHADARAPAAVPGQARE